MKIRPILNSIAALSAIGVFYTFAFCMVDDVDDSEISKEYYYNTDTEKPEETDLPLMSEDVGMGTLGVNTMKNSSAVKSHGLEKADVPEQEEVADVSSKLDNEPGYKARPEDGESGIDVVITPLTTEQTDPHREATVTYVPAEAVNAENTAASADTAPAAYTAETAIVDYDSIPEDIEDDVVISENLLQNSTEGYVNALTNFPSNKEDTDDDLIADESDITFPETTVTTAGADFSLWSDPAQTTGLIYSEGTYFETSFTISDEIPANTQDNSKSLITYDPVTGAEIFTAKFDGQKQQIDAYKLICMILSTEMSPSFSNEALKAQAVAAYSYVKYHNVNGLVPTVLVKHDIPEEMSSAVSAVWGKCCYYNGAVAQTVYTASTAGSTAKAVNVWGGKDVPYLQSVPTSFDITDDPNYGVTATYSESYMRQTLESYFGITLSNSPENWLVVTERIDGNYVANVSVDGQTNVSGRKVRENILGFGIKSWAFDVSYSDGVFTFVTYGYGHGVGMSQNGANILAKQGYTYDQILSLYFPGTTVA